MRQGYKYFTHIQLIELIELIAVQNKGDFELVVVTLGRVHQTEGRTDSSWSGWSGQECPCFCIDPSFTDDEERKRKEKLRVEDEIANALLLQYERRRLCSALRGSIQGTHTKGLKPIQ